MRILSLFGRPPFLKHFHFAWIFIWATVWILAYIFKWVESVAFISHVTMATALLTSFAAYQAARVEEKQDEDS